MKDIGEDGIQDPQAVLAVRRMLWVDLTTQKTLGKELNTNILNNYLISLIRCSGILYLFVLLFLKSEICD